jgi:hypothetical protein
VSSVTFLEETLPCLIVRQPYASLIAYGRKRWEFRSYNSNRRGRILIASSRGQPLLTSNSMLNKAATSFPRGALLASADLVNSELVTAQRIRQLAEPSVTSRIGNFEFLTADSPIGEPLTDVESIPLHWRCYAWELNDVRPFVEPVPMTKPSCSPWTSVVTKTANLRPSDLVHA